MSALTGRRLTDDERIDIERWPVECVEEVTRKRRGETWAEPCDAIAVAVRFDPRGGERAAYPVCARHARGDMATLADLLGLWDFNGGAEAPPVTAPTTHWSTTGRLHTGTVEGCGACEHAPFLVCKPLAQIVTFWRPGSHEWTWAEEYADLIGAPCTERVDARVRDEGIDFADEFAPVLLGSDGRVWDGHHRICLAIRYGIHSLMCEIAGPGGESAPRYKEPCQNRRESDSLPPLAAEQAAEGKSLGCDSHDAQEGAQ